MATHRSFNRTSCYTTRVFPLPDQHCSLGKVGFCVYARYPVISSVSQTKYACLAIRSVLVLRSTCKCLNDCSYCFGFFFSVRRFVSRHQTPRARQTMGRSSAYKGGPNDVGQQRAGARSTRLVRSRLGLFQEASSESRVHYCSRSQYTAPQTTRATT